MIPYVKFIFVHTICIDAMYIYNDKDIGSIKYKQCTGPFTLRTNSTVKQQQQ